MRQAERRIHPHGESRMSLDKNVQTCKRHSDSRECLLSRSLMSVTWSLLLILPALAADSIERKSNPTPVSGEITSVTRDEITLTAGSLKKVITVPSNDVAGVRWNNEPAKL